MKRNFITIIFGLIAAASIYAQNTRQTENGRITDINTNMRELETYLDNLSAEDKFSGAVLVAKDGVPIFKKAYGLANKSANVPNNTETKFNIASNNKMFTSVAVAQLAERGKLSFDDKISKYLPDYPNKAVADKVTIHHLLTHTSGMGNYQNEKFFEQIDKTKTLADLLPFYANEPLAFEPGAKYQYSNAGYAVLGLIIERLSGQSYFDYVRENIFKPAGMKDTDSFERGASVKNLAVGYTRMRMGQQGQQPDPNAPRIENTSMLPLKGTSAGGGYSTLDDLLKFAVALQNNKLLSKKYTEIITTGKIDVGGPMGKYAYGFGDKIVDGKHIVGHNGGSVGIAANFDMFPELGYTAVILSNYDPPAMFPVIMKIRELIPGGSPTVSQQIQKLQNEKPLSPAEQEVRKLEREWLDAYEKRDAEAMNRIVADDFKLTFSDGRVQTKADILAQLKSEKDSGRPSPKLSTEDVQSRAEGSDKVILTGRFIQRMERDGQARMMQMRYTDTYARREGRWQVISSQLTRIQPQ